MLLKKGINLEEKVERLRELVTNKKAYKDEIDRLKRQEDILTPNAIRDHLIQIKERNYNSYENRVYLINVFLYKIIVYKDGRIVAILNTTGDEGPTKLESMVRALVNQDHHIYTIKRVRKLLSFLSEPVLQRLSELKPPDSLGWR